MIELPEGRRLRAALAAVLVRDNTPELRLMHDWLDSWYSLGLMVEGMTRQGLGSSAHRLRRARLEGELLPGRDRALHRRRVGVEPTAKREV